MILSGKNGSLIARSDISGLDSSMCITKLVELNSSGSLYGPFQTRFVLLCSNISRTRLIASDVFGKDMNRLIPEYGLKGLSIDPLYYTWDKKSEVLDWSDMIPLPDDYFASYGAGSTGNTSLKYENNIDIEGSGENFIIGLPRRMQLLRKLMERKLNGLPFPNVKSFLYIMAEREKIYGREVNVQYLTRNIDTKGTGFGQINSWYIRRRRDLILYIM